MTNSANDTIPTTRLEQVLNMLKAEIASTAMDVSEFDIAGAAVQIIDMEQDMGMELEHDRDGLLIAGTLEDYWVGE